VQNADFKLLVLTLTRVPAAVLEGAVGGAVGGCLILAVGVALILRARYLSFMVLWRREFTMLPPPIMQHEFRGDHIIS
jgi:hypothetical protein